MQHIAKGENTERLCLLRVAGEIDSMTMSAPTLITKIVTEQLWEK